MMTDDEEQGAPRRRVSSRDRLAAMHDEIRNRICFLDYEPGMRLSEEALAEEFGTSRTPLRRVLARLEDEGLVRSVHGVGTLVTDVDIDEMAQVYRLRMELAELLIKLDPVPLDAAFAERFKALQQESKSLRKSLSRRDFIRINRDVFHTVLGLTANAPLRQITERLYYRTERIWQKSVLASKIDLAQEIEIFVDELDDVAAAVELGDRAAVGLLRRAHISLSFTRMRR